MKTVVRKRPAPAAMPVETSPLPAKPSAQPIKYSSGLADLVRAAKRKPGSPVIIGRQAEKAKK